MSKLVISIITIFQVIIIVITPKNVMASENLEPKNYEAYFEKENYLDEVSPYAHDIRWRYKTENGKLYGRKFNYTTNKWVGQWELVTV